MCIIDKMAKVTYTVSYMIQTVINAKDARDNFSELLGRVKFGEEAVTIEKKGKPYAVMISPEQFEAFQKEARRRFGEIVKQIQSRNTKFSEEEVMSDVNKAVAAVRRQRYAKG